MNSELFFCFEYHYEIMEFYVFFQSIAVILFMLKFPLLLAGGSPFKLSACPPDVTLVFFYITSLLAQYMFQAFLELSFPAPELESGPLFLH